MKGRRTKKGKRTTLKEIYIRFFGVISKRGNWNGKPIKEKKAFFDTADSAAEAAGWRRGGGAVAAGWRHGSERFSWLQK